MNRSCVMMAAMWKRLPPGITILLLAVALLLPLLAVLQYRWLGQISEGERERMESLLRSAATQFTQAFDAEIARVYATFQRQKATEFAQISEEYGQRFEEWKATAPHPALIRDLLVATLDGPALLRLWRFNQAENRLVASNWPGDIGTRLNDRVTRPRLEILSGEQPALVIPPEDLLKTPPDAALAPKPGVLCAVVMFDPDYIRTVFLPDLTKRFFSPQNGFDYNVIVTSRSEPSKVIFASPPQSTQVAATELTTGLLGLQLEALLRRTPGGKDGGQDSPNAIVRIVKRQPIGEGEDTLTGRWRLHVGYQAGSLEEAIANGRRRNLAISFGILLLLGTSVGLIVISSLRATRLAHDQMKFVAGVSHELRTPLAVICSAGENLADKVVGETPQVAEYGRVIRDEGRRLTQMVEQVLEYAGAQSGRPAYELRETRAAEALEDAMNDLRNEAAKAGFEIESEIERDLPPINVDSAALARSLQNLVSNAIKYDRGQRWIGLTARKANGAGDVDEIQITVTDRGRGISADDLPHVFEPFYRGREATADQIKGSGLGLSLVQHMAAAHGGRVSVRSTPGEGSVFTIHLPIASPAKSNA
jgi:signal transduction histidine kinase